MIQVSLISLFITIGLFWIIDWKLLIFCLFLLGICYSILGFITKSKILKNSYLIDKSAESQIKTLQEALGSIRDLILDGSYNIFTSDYLKNDIRIRQKRATNEFLGTAPRYLLETIAIILLILISINQLGNNGGNNAGLPILGTIALAAQRLLPSFQLIYYSWSGILARKASIDNVLKVLKYQVNSGNYKKVKPYKFKENIELQNLSFQYPGNNKFIFKNINLTIKKGEKIGIVGMTGSGKSTFIDIIMVY